MLVAVMQLRNEASLLSGCLEHLAPHVDGVIALDDGSTDETRHLLAESSVVKEVIERPAARGGTAHVWREGDNRRELIKAALAHGATWFLAIDADERYETRFLADLRRMIAAAEGAGRCAIGLPLRELYDSALHYRVDGVWGQKAQVRCFRAPREDQLPEGMALHAPWVKLGDRQRDVYWVERNLYHLHMIRHEDRVARRDRHKALDPENRFQKIGYDYLTDDTGALLREVGSAERYELSTVPRALVEHRGPLVDVPSARADVTCFVAPDARAPSLTRATRWGQ